MSTAVTSPLPFSRYVANTEFASYEAFARDFQIRVPTEFNFAYDVLDDLARTRSAQTALLWCDDHGAEKQISFAAMAEQSARAAQFFHQCGVRKGDAVMLLLRRRYEFWFALLGLHRLGAVAVPATHLLTAKDIAYRISAADVRMLVCVASPALQEHVEQAERQLARPLLGKALANLTTGALPGGWLDFNAGLADAPASFPRPIGAAAPGVRDRMLLYFTSGTTGHPKIVAHNFLYPLGHIVTACHWQQVRPGGLHLTLADTGWAKAAWGKIYGQWLAGCAVMAYDYERFSPRRLLEMLQRHRVTSFCAPPTVYRFLIREPLAECDLRTLEHCTVAGEPLNPEVYQAFLKGTGLKLMEGYGQTELTLVIGTFPGMTPRPGSMGRPAPGWHVELRNDDGHPCQPGEPGQIVLRIPQPPPPGFFLDYEHEPDRTRQAWHDGLYFTGDIAWQDEDGYFWFVGRADDVIKSSGYRIGPFEVESALMEHTAVVECAVTGVPDEERGQAVKATIVLATGVEPTPTLALELQEHVKRVTAPYKCPRQIEFVAELPKTISGKVRRTEIRAPTRTLFPEPGA